MAAGLVILIVATSTGPADAASVDATRAAAGDALVVVDDDAATTDDDARLLGDMLAASNVAFVRWSPDRTRATVEVRSSATEWNVSELVFAPNEPLAERGRAVGLTISALLPPPETAKPLPPPTSAPKPKPAPPPPPPERPLEAARPPRFTLDAAGTAAVASGTTGFGARASLGFAPRGGALSALFAVTARSETDSSLAASTLAFRAGPGFLAAWSNATFGVGVRGELLLFWDVVERTMNDQRLHRSRFMPGADVALQAMTWVGVGSAIVLSVGAESSFGRTEIAVGSRVLGALPIVRGVAELGLRTRF